MPGIARLTECEFASKELEAVEVDVHKSFIVGIDCRLQQTFPECTALFPAGSQV
jgi:hypothetical protein